MEKKTKLTIHKMELKLPAETIGTIEEIKRIVKTDSIKESLELLLSLGALLYKQIRFEYTKQGEVKK